MTKVPPLKLAYKAAPIPGTQTASYPWDQHRHLEAAYQIPEQLRRAVLLQRPVGHTRGPAFSNGNPPLMRRRATCMRRCFEEVVLLVPTTLSTKAGH